MIAAAHVDLVRCVSFDSHRDDVHKARVFGTMPEKLWAGYTRVMSGYGTKLVRLLGKGWSGPHGSGGGRWEMMGQWLGGGLPLPRGYEPPRLGKAGG
jgi:hypothetical protein